MKALSFIILILAVSLSSAKVSAQVLRNDIKIVRTAEKSVTTPSFAGTWKLAPDFPVTSAEEKRLLFVITQLPDSVKIRFQVADGKLDESFNVTIYTDGRVSQIPNLVGLGAPIEIIGEWRDEKFHLRKAGLSRNSRESVEIELSADSNRLVCRADAAPSDLVLERVQPISQRPVEAPPVRSKVLLQDLKVTSRPN